jgi:cation:H+ antiporter
VDALLAIVVLVGGFALLMKAADRFVYGASSLAARLEISPLVIGAVVLGFGTSAPELVVSTVAAAQGQIDLGLGNIVGSNIANLTLVLGLGALIRPIAIPEGTKRRGAVCLVAMVGFALLVQFRASWWQGAVLVVGVLVAVYLMFVIDTDDLAPPVESSEGSMGSDWAWTVGSLLATLVAAQGVVWSATELAARLGLRGGFVGLSIVAVGTSLPELVTVVAAARRNEASLILGSLLGSNVFNSLAVGAGLFLAGNGQVADPWLSRWGSVAMVVVILAVMVFLAPIRSRLIVRAEGAALLFGYVGIMAVFATQAGT